MDRFEHAPGGVPPVERDVQETLLEPFISAARFVVAEMANTEVLVREPSQGVLENPFEEISAVVGLTSAAVESLVLSFPVRTAAALAGRMLAEESHDVGPSMIRDCMGELANIVAGQAKALLAHSPYRFTFSVPTVAVGARPELISGDGSDRLIAVFGSDLGEFVLQLFLRLKQLSGHDHHPQ